MPIRRWLYICIPLLLQVSCAQIQTVDSPNGLKVGERIEGVMQLGIGPARKSIPLPSGEWEVLRVAEYKVRLVHSSNQFDAPTMLSVVLVQRIDRDFAMLMHVRANKERNKIGQWWDEPCKRKDTLHRNSYNSSVREVKCLVLNHISGFMAQGVSTFSDVRQWAAREQMNIPNTVLEAALTQFKPGEFLAVIVWVNPALRKLDSPERAWAASPFHRDYIAKDAERQRYVEEFVNWSEEYMTHLSGVSNHAEAAITAVRTTQKEISTFR